MAITPSSIHGPSGPLLLVIALGACDPAWSIRNVATAAPMAKVDAACVEAGLQASGIPFKNAGIVAEPARSWYVAPADQHAVRVIFDPKKPGQIHFEMINAGTAAPPGAAEQYRSTRDGVMVKLRETCGPLELSPESCQRMECNQGPAAMTP